jgi:hypothetical protein
MENIFSRECEVQRKEEEDFIFMFFSTPKVQVKDKEKNLEDVN